MGEFIDSMKALCVNPLKVDKSAGVVLAFLGLARCFPLEHGVRGCASFTKLFFMRHFQEPIPLQTTAIDHGATILGADDNLVDGLRTVIERHQPEVVGIAFTTMTEFQGADALRSVAEFRDRFPEHAHVAVIPVSTTDAPDGLEGGYARAVEAIVGALVPPTRSAGACGAHINILASSMLTPGDVDTLKDWVRAFDLRPVVIPDLGDSVDGHLLAHGFSPLTYGGVARTEVERAGQSAATIVVGPSLGRAADLLKARTQVPDFRFPSLTGLEACDELTTALRDISGRSVPDRLRRQRDQLLDAMVDCHFRTADTSAMVAGDPDLAGALVRFARSVGVRVPTIVTTAKAPSLRQCLSDRIVVGDLDDLEREATEHPVQLLIANSHANALAARLRVPLMRAGFPQHDVLGAHTKSWIGYAGTRQTLFEVANLLARSQPEASPYSSIYGQPADPSKASAAHGRTSPDERTLP
ncbi:MAG: nitrogenase iron-molybdenum cofactor biosynthesis protein NifN [Polyangiaceae bacterium]|jgi:nitrogenase molybdenum-iron protein NifN